MIRGASCITLLNATVDCISKHLLTGVSCIIYVIVFAELPDPLPGEKSVTRTMNSVFVISFLRR